MWDLGGQTSIRPYWRCYYADTKAVVYVVDSTDRERLNINKAELLAMMNEEELQDAKLLVFANKQVRARDGSDRRSLESPHGTDGTLTMACRRAGGRRRRINQTR